MPRVPRGKVMLLAYIDKRVAEEFRKLVGIKHGARRGALSFEVEEALRNWIALHRSSHTQTHTSHPNPAPKIFQVARQVKEYLRARYGYILTQAQQMPRAHIIEGIKAVRGTDPRTVRKWFKEFLRWGIIKHISGEIFEFAGC